MNYSKVVKLHNSIMNINIKEVPLQKIILLAFLALIISCGPSDQQMQRYQDKLDSLVNSRIEQYKKEHTESTDKGGR